MYLSIIIPVYNSGKYLEECMESIIKEIRIQDEIEVILIDDGSTDNSYEICEKYSEKYNVINVIHTKNNGVSIARNIGIEQAKGNYIMFVDSDDKLLTGWYEQILSSISEDEYDIIFFSESCKEIDVSKKNIIKRMLWMQAGNISYGTPWSKIIKRKLLLDNNIRFAKKIINWEDLLFCIQIINCAKNYKHIGKGIYIYRNNLSSSTHKFNEELIKNDKELYKELKLIIDKSQYLNMEEKELMLNQFLLLNLTMICGRIAYIHKYKEARKKFYIFNKFPYCNIKTRKITFKRDIIVLLVKLRFYILVYFLCKINNYLLSNNKRKIDSLKII